MKNSKYILIIFSFLFFVYVFYRSEIVSEGQKNDYYFKYYIISILFIIFSIFYLIINHKLKIIFNILLISLLSSFYLFEFYLIFFGKNYENLLEIKSQKYYEINKKNYDKRKLLDIYGDLIKKNKKLLFWFPLKII